MAGNESFLTKTYLVLVRNKQFQARNGLFKAGNKTAFEAWNLAFQPA